MSSIDIPEYALGRLRAAKAAMMEDIDINKILYAQERVVARYGPAFQLGKIESIEEKVLSSFLYFENNCHWSGLHRQVNRICSDMSATRAALADLVDDSLPIASRMEAATSVKGLGKGIITAILHVAYPRKYGVWNNTSTEGLVELGLFPNVPRGAKFGERYSAVNDVLNSLAAELDVDLWTLDTIWWYIGSGQDDVAEMQEPVAPMVDPLSVVNAPKASRFSLERHLHDYMFDNWSSLKIALDWEIYARDGEPDVGYEFRTPIGRIDLLARHKREPRWLVIELKREKSSDAVVGQILRYMGWVQRHLCDVGETVEGLVVATEGDAQLHYALDVVERVSFKSYQVEFHLEDGPPFEQFARP